MNIIICVDKKNGMLFNGRRQSQDRVLREKIMELCPGKKIWMNSYSASQFSEYSNTSVSEDFLQQAGPGEYCFVENVSLTLDNVNEIYIFQWNRHYPADTYFDIDLKKNGFKKKKQEDFKGSSHDKITLEIYERN